MTYTSPLRRVSHTHRCPICDHDSWCSIGEKIVICMRAESRRPAKRGGWIHRLDGRQVPHVRVVFRAAPPKPKLTIAQCELMHRQAVTALQPRELQRLSSALKVSLVSLQRLGVGWHDRKYVFPMRDVDGRIIGLHCRIPNNGKKPYVAASSTGLIIPSDLPAGLSTLLICEGESDTAAALDYGQHAIGRPGVGACTPLLIEFVRRRRPELAVIIADNDTNGIGIHGARDLARQLAAAGQRTRVVTLPGAKDLREWIQLPDTTPHDLQALIDLPATSTVQIEGAA